MSDPKKHTMEIKTSKDFANNPEGALDALDATGFALFMISPVWFNDERAKKEWRFAMDHKKPMIYIFREPEKIVKEPLLLKMMQAPTLIGTINDYGDTDRTGVYVQAMIAAYCKDHNIVL